MNSLISLKKISKKYSTDSKVRALKSIDLDFKLGKTYSVVGPSGSGKSTLLNILSLIDQPSSGVIKMDGQVIDFENQNYNDKFRASDFFVFHGIEYYKDVK